MEQGIKLVNNIHSDLILCRTTLRLPEEILDLGPNIDLASFPGAHFSLHSSMAPWGGVIKGLFTVLNFSRPGVGYFGLFTTDQFFSLLLYLPDKKT